MKYLFTLAFLALAGHTFAAIEFSEELDQFAPDTGSVATASSDAGAAASPTDTTVRSAGNAAASNAAVTSAQSTGVVGSMGPIPVNSSSLTGSTLNGGGGNTGTGGVAGNQVGTDDLLAEAQVAEEQRGGDTSSLAVEAPEVVSMPEPATAIVWGLLAVCGFGVYRKRQ